MLNEESVRTVEAARWREPFLRPIYEDYGFAQIPATIRGLFAGEPGGVPFGPGEGLRRPYDSVVLLLVDAFGWRFFERYADSHPFLRRFLDDGLVNRLTTQFPSTTSAHLTAIHTGLPPARSGIFEWFFYEPRLDRIIAPLLFSYAGDTTRETLRGAIEPAALFPQQTLYQELAALGVESTVAAPAEYARSSFTSVVTDGATTMPYLTPAEALVNTAAVAAQAGRRYVYLYFAGVDTICHRYGPDSPQVEAEILGLLDLLERVLHPTLTRIGRRTLLLMAADHGQTAIDPATTIYLNRALPELAPLLRQNRNGQVLAPAGSPRDMFLYVREGLLDEARGVLERKLAGRAIVVPVAELAEQGFFGPGAPTSELLARAGDLVVLPYAGESVWWHEPGRFEQRYYGHHGGLLREEAETILLALPY